jgi:hypothetical protein
MGLYTHIYIYREVHILTFSFSNLCLWDVMKDEMSKKTRLLRMAQKENQVFRKIILSIHSNLLFDELSQLQLSEYDDPNDEEMVLAKRSDKHSNLVPSIDGDGFDDDGFDDDGEKDVPEFSHQKKQKKMFSKHNLADLPSWDEDWTEKAESIGMTLEKVLYDRVLHPFMELTNTVGRTKHVLETSRERYFFHSFASPTLLPVDEHEYEHEHGFDLIRFD